MNANSTPIEVSIMHDEENATTGQVIPIGPNTARVIDTGGSPGDYHLGDIVELVQAPGSELHYQLGEVLYREYEAQTTVWYNDEWQYQELKGVMAHLSGMVGNPSSADVKAVDVAHPARIDVVKLAKALGLCTDP